jgi:hypothetical protein
MTRCYDFFLRCESGKELCCAAVKANFQSETTQIKQRPCWDSPGRRWLRRPAHRQRLRLRNSQDPIIQQTSSMRKSPTLPWRRSIPSIKKPLERGNWAYNLPMVAVVVAADMAVAVADMAAAAAAGIEVVAAAGAASEGAAATVAAAAAYPGAVAGRPARFNLHKTKSKDALSSKAGSHYVESGFLHGVQGLNAIFREHNRRLDWQGLETVARRETVCLCSGSWRPKRDEDAACSGVASLTECAY